MPDATAGKAKIREYFGDRRVSLTSVATYLNAHKQDLNDYLSGKDQGKKAHETLTAIIEYYETRQECLRWKIF